MDSGDERVQTIKVGEHLGWGNNTKKALAEINEDYILYLQEDYFLVSPINSQAVKEHIRFCIANNVDYIRLEAPYRDNMPLAGNKNYGQDPISERYSLCLQPSIWRKEILQKFCFEGWTGWDYEAKICKYIIENAIQITSVVINSKMKSMIGFPLVEGTAIRKGIWTREGYRYLIENGFEKEAKGRKVEGVFMNWCMKQHGIFKIPTRLIIRLMQKYMNRK